MGTIAPVNLRSSSYSAHGNQWSDLPAMLLVFILCPFASFLLALTQMKTKSSYVIYALFGMIFVWHMDHTGNTGFDDFIAISQRVVESRFTFMEVMKGLSDIITFSPDAPKEWYEMFMIWLTKCFSTNYHVYFLLCSIPWLFFELSSCRYLTNDLKFRQSWICLVVLMLFVLPRDIITLQNPRFTTATWLAVFCTLGYFFGKPTRKRLYCIMLLATPLIHSAFWFYIIIFIVCNILQAYPGLMIWMLYISIPFSYMSYDLLTSINFHALPIPTSIATWIDIYLSEEYYSHFILQEGASGFYWVGNLFNFLMKTAYLLIPIYLWKYRLELMKDPKLWRFCGFFIAFYAIVSFIQFVPVLGERFYWLVRIFGIFIWFKAIYPRHNRVIWFILFSCSFSMFRRYLYGGAVSICVPLDIFYDPLPIAIMDSLR